MHAKTHDEGERQRVVGDRKRRAEESQAQLTLKKRRRDSASITPPPPGVTMKETAFKHRLSTWVMENDAGEIDVATFFNSMCGKMRQLIIRELEHSELKINAVLKCIYVKKTGEGEEARKQMSFKTKNHAVYNVDELDRILGNFRLKLMREVEDFEEKDSGWTLEAIENLELRLNKLNPMRGSSYIDLPPKIKAKKAIVNVRNADQQCFKWAVLSALHPVQRTEHGDRTSTYAEYQDELNFDGIEFPVGLQSVKKFEKQNNISISIFSLSEKLEVYPALISDNDSSTHIDLLYLKNQQTAHYCWIKNLSKLVSSQYSNYKGRKYICRRCLTSFTTEDTLTKHSRLCINHEPVLVEMPKKPELRFENAQHSIKVPFVCYADFECLTEKIHSCQPNPAISHTNAYQKHSPMSFAYYIVYDGELYKPPTVYRGADAAKRFMELMAEEAREITAIYRQNVPMKPLTREMLEQHGAAEVCYLCNRPFSDEDVKVRDHSHITGIYRGPSHNSCNLRNRNPRFLPIFFHNLSGYDSHLFVKELSFEDGDVTIIPNNEEKYISFSKKLKDCVDLRFLDSCRFMMSSLDALSRNLKREQFRHMFAHFPEDKVDLLLRKGIFPYDYMDDAAKCDEIELPPKEAFYSELNECAVSDDDYAHAQRVWKEFKVETLGEYADLYVKTDVILLCDIFENFRNVCMTTYRLDPAWYFTAPGLSWDAMLKSTQVGIALIEDYEMLLFIEEGIRGGISQCSWKYGRANNPYVDDYNPDEDRHFLIYLDANNLYGYAMSQPLPLRDFKWCEPLDVLSIPEKSPLGYIFEVDLKYPASLQNAHSDLPLAPENRIPDGCREKRLLTTLYDKEKYIVHYKNLQQYVRLGLEIVKVHRVLQFRQEVWLKPYIDMNTALRTQADNEFDKCFYKLMNNAVFGKTMENIRKRVDIRLCTDERKIEKLISKPNFDHRTIYSEQMAAIHLRRVKAVFNKPIVIGMTILDLSKVLMYDFHYTYIKEKYNDVKLLYMDTDSFVYDIQTSDLYADMKADIAKFDTSDYDASNPYGMPRANKKVLGLMKDETRGHPMTEFVGLRSKMYSFRTQGEKDVKKLKGVKKAAVESKITFDQYKACLFNDEMTHTSFNLIRSMKHDIFSIRVNKLALCNRDQKRFCKIGEIKTLPWGHKDVPLDIL